MEFGEYLAKLKGGGEHQYAKFGKLVLYFSFPKFIFVNFIISLLYDAFMCL
jgi:hypothetical protein